MIRIEIDFNNTPEELKATSDYFLGLSKVRTQENEKSSMFQHNLVRMANGQPPIKDTLTLEENAPIHEVENGNVYPDVNSSSGRTVEKFRVEQNEIPEPPKRKTNYTHDAPESIVPLREHEVDSRGLAWNPEIHSETKAKNKDGTWRYRRKVDKNLIVELEEAAMPVQENDVPAPPAQRVIQLDAAPITFIDLMKKINNAKLAGRITQERIQEISFQVIGDKNLSKLSTQQDMIPEVSAIIDAELLM